MRRASLYFCCSLYFLGTLYISRAYTYGTGGHLEYSNVVSTEQKVQAEQPSPGAVPRLWTGDSEFIKNPPVMRPPYHVFPMFQHVPVPLVDMELFRPVSERRHFPKMLTSLLVPQVNPQSFQVSPVRNARGVEVWCGHSKISVRVNKKLLGFRCSRSSFHLGTCPVSRSDNSFLYFHYDLNACDSSLTMMNGQIIYSNTVRFTPEPQGTVIRAVPLTLNIQCLYNRFHYSYKIGFLPVMRERIFHKTFEHRAKFSISVCNEHWQRLEGSGSFLLGEPMYFEVSAAHTSKDERIFVDSCYATASKDPKSTPKHSIISNYGCMEDSRRHGSLSRFYQRQSNIIRFSVDAFLLPQVTRKYLYLHCTISVHGDITSTTAKSCTYNTAQRRWKELHTDAIVCACCDSTCKNEDTSPFPHVTQSMITSKLWILDNNEQSLIKMKRGSIRVQEDTEKMKFKIPEGIDEEEDDVEIVTETEEQTETKEEDKKMTMTDVHEDVEVIVVREETTADSKDEWGDLSAQMKVVEIEEDPGRLQSTSRPDTVEQSSTQFIEELEDDNDEESSKSGHNELIDFTREEPSKDKTHSVDLEKNIHVRSKILSQIAMDEETFLNAKQEPVEWSENKQ